MKPLYRPKEDMEKSFLHRKWGSADAERLERTHLYILEVISHRWESMTEEQRRYFRDKEAWEKKWKNRKEEEFEYRTPYKD